MYLFVPITGPEYTRTEVTPEEFKAVAKKTLAIYQFESPKVRVSCYDPDQDAFVLVERKHS